jgi:hypothetical protein
MRTIKAKDFVAPWAIFVIGSFLVGACQTAIVTQAEHLILIAGGSINTVKMAPYLAFIVIGLPLSFLVYYWSVKQFLIPKLEAPTARK